MESMDIHEIQGIHSGTLSPGERILGFFHPVNEASLPTMKENNARILEAWRLGCLEASWDNWAGWASGASWAAWSLIGTFAVVVSHARRCGEVGG